MALVLLHGWPGSVFEFYDALKELLSDPSWPFDVIVPSLPGFAFSTPLQAPTGCRRIAALVDTLVTRHLGFDSYIAQGGDWGAVVASWLGFDHADACRAIHLNAEGIRVHGAPQYEPILEGDWTDEERRHFAFERGELGRELGYYVQQSTRPQTLGHAMRNDPVGAAAWISEKFHGWSNLGDDEDPGDYFGWDRLLTNALLYVVPDSFVTATWIYAGHDLHDPSTLPPGARIEIPTGFVSCADPIVPPPPRSMIERAHNLVWWREDDAGHFAAFEKPQAFVAGLKDFINQVC
jgi:pimeloyl-ACP methyl ester carboxylesterase